MLLAPENLNGAMEKALRNPVWLEECYARLRITTARVVIITAFTKLAVLSDVYVDAASK